MRLLSISVFLAVSLSTAVEHGPWMTLAKTMNLLAAREQLQATGTLSSLTVTTSIAIMVSTASATADSTITDSTAANATSPSTSIAPIIGVHDRETINTSAQLSLAKNQPCNGYVELCTRNYSNITMVAAHNSPFAFLGNPASNQLYHVMTQLNDGIRMLQFQTHVLNESIYLCHTSCELLNAGPLETYLTTVTNWLDRNPYEVVTILMGNDDRIDPRAYIAPFVDSGMIKYVYTPPNIPMGLDDWPTLSSLITAGTRVIVFLDYLANQATVPYILDEFSQLWETPFSPTDRHFFCTVQRPPMLSIVNAKNRMYMANHNLNFGISFAGIDILLPDLLLLDETNSVFGFGSLGEMAKECDQNWGRPPNFLLVDYYNFGNFNGSVFQVAATMNNVTYNGHCCGTKTSSALIQISQPWGLMRIMLLVAGLISVVNVMTG